MIACENSGRSVANEFPEVRKFVEAGATTKPKKDYELFPDKIKGFISIDSAPLQKSYMTAMEIWLLERAEPLYIITSYLFFER